MTRLQRQMARLRTFYGLLPAPGRDPFRIFLWEVLSLRTTPARRDAALAELKRLRALTPDAMWRTPPKGWKTPLPSQVRTRLSAFGPCGPASGSSGDRRPFPRILRGPIGPARRALTAFPPLGDGFIRRMLLFAAHRRVLGVDAHIVRVGLRLGYGEDEGRGRGLPGRSVRRALARDWHPMPTRSVRPPSTCRTTPRPRAWKPTRIVRCARYWRSAPRVDDGFAP